MTQDVAHRRPYPKLQKTWFSESLVFRLLDRHESSAAEQGQEYYLKKQVLDFAIHGGRVAAKVQSDGSRPFRAVIAIPQLSPIEWEKVFEQFSGRAIFLAQLLSGAIPQEAAAAFQQAGVPFLLDLPPLLEFSCDCSTPPTTCEHTAALVFRLGEALDSDPFVFFSILGHSKDEVLYEIKKRRAALQRRVSQESPAESVETTPDDLLPYLSAPEKYWSVPHELFELSFSLRADELPAGILRRLDPIPVGGYEDDVEFQLEDAYAQVARRAQVFGLGLVATGKSNDSDDSKSS